MKRTSHKTQPSFVSPSRHKPRQGNPTAEATVAGNLSIQVSRALHATFDGKSVRIFAAINMFDIQALEAREKFCAKRRIVLLAQIDFCT